MLREHSFIKERISFFSKIFNHSEQGFMDIIYISSGKNISMLVKGKKVNYSSLNKKVDATLPMNLKSKEAFQKPTGLAKPRPKQPSFGSEIGSDRKPLKKQLQMKDVKSISKNENTIQKIKITNLPSISIEAEKSLLIKTQDKISQTTIRYNHYKDLFPSVNGLLSFQTIEQKYGFGDVFKGNFIPILKVFKTGEEISPEACGAAIEYTWKVQENQQYRLQIQEDLEQESKHERKPYKAPQSGLKHCACNLKNRAFHDLTAEMKKLQVHELGGAKHRELLQQRDLEDILYSK